MEQIEQQPKQITPEARRAIAWEIYAEITRSLKQLRALPEVADDHSSVVELENEQSIALRALQRVSDGEEVDIFEHAEAA